MNKIMFKNTWKNPENHYIEVLKSPRYKQLVELENLISVETMKFYEKKDL